MNLDDLDQRLLVALRRDARSANADLARRLGVSRTTIKSRIDRLEGQGVVAGYTVRMTDAYERARLRAYVMLTVQPKEAAAVEAGLRVIPEVQRLQTVSGGFDFISLIGASTVGEMDLLIDRIGAIPGVERTNTAVVLSTKFDR